MKNRIYFFTDTGNSLKAAKEKAHSLVECEIVAIHKDVDLNIPTGYDRMYASSIAPRRPLTSRITPMTVGGIPTHRSDRKSFVSITKEQNWEDSSSTPAGILPCKSIYTRRRESYGGNLLDIILVTHQHPDHNRIDLPPIKENCTIIQNQDALFDGTYRRFELGGIVIQAVEAYNLVHSKRKCVGYLVTVDYKKIYFAGDTSRTKQMDTFAKENIDYAFLPTDGFANMGPRGVAKCSHIIKAKHTIPST